MPPGLFAPGLVYGHTSKILKSNGNFQLQPDWAT